MKNRIGMALPGALVAGLVLVLVVWVLQGRKGAEGAPGPVADVDQVNEQVQTFAPASLAAALAFLYTGDNPRQVGVRTGAIEARRAAVLRGIARGRPKKGK